jgi:ParB family chromosome partitioning protein
MSPTLELERPYAAPELPPPAGGKLMLRVDRIIPNPKGPRRVIQPEALQELAESLKRWGQLQPVVVRPAAEPGFYELICGERRWRAHKLAGLPVIWAVEREALNDEMLALALVENLQRSDLSHAEKVSALDELAETVQANGLRGTARYLGIDAGWLSRQLAVRRDPVIFPALECARIGFGQAAELLRAPGPERERLLARVVESPAHVTTATIREWVGEARSRQRQERRRGRDAPAAAVDSAARFDTLVESLESMGIPTCDEERAALQRLIETAQRLLGSGTTTPKPRQWRDVTCLLCGSQAGAVDGAGRLRPSSADSIRRTDGRLSCGRCGGSLVSSRPGVV